MNLARSTMLALVFVLPCLTGTALAKEAPVKDVELKDTGVTAKPGDKKSKKGPGFTLATKAKARTAEDKTEASIMASIDNQKMILELEDTSGANYPKMLIALADFYWDLSEVKDRKAHTDEIEQKIFDCEEAKNTACVQKLKAKQQQILDDMRYYQDLTVDTYRKVIDDHPTMPNLDETRYFLAYHLSLMGRMDEATATYTQLILQHPQSKYVPDALVNVGEAYFAQNDFASALKLYERAEQYQDSPVYAYSIYKQGWCHYNLGAYAVSMDKLLRVIKIARQQQAQGIKGAIGLEKEAQNDLVLPYSKIGKPSAAIAFFKKYAATRYLDLCARLASIYTEQTEYARSSKLLKTLIKEAAKVQPDGKDLRYMVIRFQRLIVDNMHRSGNKENTVAEVAELIKQYEAMKSAAPSKFLEKESAGIDDLILQIAFGYHQEYKNTKEQKTLEYTAQLYDEYLRLFSNKKNAYVIKMNVALMHLMTEKYEQAARGFEEVIAMRPDGKYADEAAERAVIAYLRSIQVDNKAVLEADSGGDDLKQQPLSKEAARFVTAVDRWQAILERKRAKGIKIDDQNRDNIPKALYLAAKLHYNFNHFAAAAKQFEQFLTNHPNNDLSPIVARHLLSCFNLAHDSEKLLVWANKIEKNKEWMVDDIPETIERIRSELDFVRCFKPEKAGKHLKAANCFLKYHSDHEQSEKAPTAVFNAAVNFFKAKQVEKAIQTQQMLYAQYKKSEMGQKALYAIAEIFRETTVYDQAANIYEHFVNSHKKHKLAEKALQYASIYRKTLGEYDRAVENLELYLKRYGTAEKNPRVHLDIILIREKQERPTYVIKEAKAHLKRYTKEPPGIRLQALGALGKAWQIREKDKEAADVFDKTIKYFATIPKTEVEKLDMAAISAVAEAHFNLGQTVVRKAARIQLKGSEKEIKAATKKKLELLAEVQTTYLKVIDYGHPGWVIAARTQLGYAYANFADSLENSEVPKKIKRLGVEAEDEYKGLLAESAQKIREKAIDNYRAALDIARSLHWFNEYSEKAEERIALLDLKDASIKEYRLRPVHTVPNGAVPQFKQEAN